MVLICQDVAQNALSGEAKRAGAWKQQHRGGPVLPRVDGESSWSRWIKGKSTGKAALIFSACQWSDNRDFSIDHSGDHLYNQLTSRKRFRQNPIYTHTHIYIHSIYIYTLYIYTHCIYIYTYICIYIYIYICIL